MHQSKTEAAPLHFIRLQKYNLKAIKTVNKLSINQMMRVYETGFSEPDPVAACQ